MNEHRSEISPEATAAQEQKVIIDRSQALRTFTLNRPRVLNALDEDMCRVLSDELPAIARNSDVYIVALTSSSPKAFCAGGDVLA